MIVIHTLQQATRAAAALIGGGDLPEHGLTTRMFTIAKDERAEREITGEVG